MDGILRRQGMTRGTVGERMTALGKEPRFGFEESDAGRAKLMAYLNERVADMRKRLPRAFEKLVPGNFEIKRMAPEVEPGAPGAYGGSGSIDGTVPGKFWINMHKMRPCLAGRVHLQTTAVPVAVGIQRVHRRLGVVRRTAGR
jgi:uncharacterized protein (DUF885 family)